jgi:hypothetical protein
MAHAQHLITMVHDDTDEALKSLLDTIQLAVFSRDLDLSQFGEELKGIYNDAWDAIALSVEPGGIDPHI